MLIPNLTVFDYPDYGFPDNLENLLFNGKFREKLIFFFSVNSISLKVFNDADCEFNGF